jgi:hypothetical protein
LKKSPSERYQSAAEIARDLRELNGKFPIDAAQDLTS